MRDDPTLYQGYLKVDRAPWQLVCSGISEEDCWRILRAHTTPPRAKVVSKKVVCRLVPKRILKKWKCALAN